MTNLKLVCVLLLVCLLPLKAQTSEQLGSVKATSILKTDTSWNGKPIEYPSGEAKITGIVIEIAPGAETGWHMHPVPSFALILEGELEVRLKNGDVKRLKAGEAFAEVVNTLHNGRNTGSVPVKLVVFYAGAVGQELSIKGPESFLVGCPKQYADVEGKIEKGQSKQQIIKLLGRPYETKMTVKSNKYIWGPEEGFWDEIPMGSKLEIWSFKFSDGHLNLYFVNDGENIDFIAFAPKGVVY